MKKSLIISLLAFITALFISACGKDSADLAWTNGYGNTINDIVWASGDQEWKTASGYTNGTTTESKEVKEMSGNVACTFWNGSDFSAATIKIQNENSTNLELKKGESYVYTIIP
jgi:hypothetical protein